MADLAPWIWNITQGLLPCTTQIADWSHVKERLSKLAKVLYGAGSESAKSWIQRRDQELDSGRCGDLLRAVRGQADHGGERARATA